MEGYNAIGIESLLDWARIRKLLSIGLFASLLACLFVYKHLMRLTGDYESTIALMLNFVEPSW